MGKALQLYKSLLRNYGKQEWWPADSAFEVVVGAILTQNTNWKNVEKAIANLKKAKALEPEKIAEMPMRELRRLIRPSGFYRQKAGRLQLFCKHLGKKYKYDVRRLFKKPLQALREELLSLHGIGQETADSILLYAAEKPSFVVDAYTFRFNDAFKLKKLREKGKEKRYGELKAFFEANLPKSVPVYKEYHAIIVEWGKRMKSSLNHIPSGDDEGVYTKKFKASLRRGMKDIKRGRTYSLRDVKKSIYK